MVATKNMIKNITKRTLEQFNQRAGDESTPYQSFYELINIALISDGVSSLVIGHSNLLEFIDDLKIISINDKEINIVVEQHTDEEDVYGFIDAVSYHITIDYIGEILRINNIHILNSDEGYEYMKEDDFNKILA